MSARTRALLVVNPNNPTGSFVSVAEADAAVDLCAAARRRDHRRRGVRRLRADAGRGRRAARLFDRGRCPRRSRLAGCRNPRACRRRNSAWMVAGGPARCRRRRVERLELACDTYLSVSTPVQLAAAELLERGPRSCAANPGARHRELRALAARATGLRRAASHKATVDGTRSFRCHRSAPRKMWCYAR